MNILTVSSLYPNDQQPRHGIFVENRLKHFLGRYSEHSLTVIAPVPYFPFAGRLSKRYQKYALIQPVERRYGITIHHPRYLMIPGLGMYLQPFFYYRAIKKLTRSLCKNGLTVDVIDAHYAYPDGVAATMLARRLRVPIAITARGSDLTLLPGHALPRRLIRWALTTANACIGVCKALADEMKELAPKQDAVHVLRNGVDLELFRPLPDADRQNSRQSLGLPKGAILLCVGELIERKGHHLVIDALKQLPDATLLLVGEGEREQALRGQARRDDLADRVIFMGSKSPTELAEIYACADIMILASSREGWANVLLESMACGTPVVATSVWGTPEVVQSPDAGVLIEARTADAIAEGVNRLLEHYPSRDATRVYAESFSWDATSDGLQELFSRMVMSPRKKPGHAFNATS